jgi:predicted nucleic acid-binding protein
MHDRRVIVDTNVVYAGLYSADGASHQVLRRVERGSVRPVLSTALLFEYEDVLRRNQTKLGLSDRAIDQVLDGFCMRGEPREVHFLWRPKLSDPKDDHILELAVAAGGVDIVTHNVRHFAGAMEFGVRAVTPAGLSGELK